MNTLGDKVWELPQEKFVAIWNAAASLDEVAAQVRAAVGPPAPLWAVMVRGAAMRDGGTPLKHLKPAASRPAA